MSRETEKILRELHKQLDTTKLNSEEEVGQAVREFMEQYNAKLKDGAGDEPMDAYDFLEKAEMADSTAEALKYARKALSLDEYCLDADVVIAELQSKDIRSYHKKLEEVIKKGEEQLKQRDISFEEDMGKFYDMFETRPYMRARQVYVTMLLEQGKFRKAIKECEELVRLSENDNLGLRYMLMALYAYFEEKENAENLYKRYDKEPSAFMLLPLIALCYKSEDEAQAILYLKELLSENKEALKAFKRIMTMDEDDIEEIQDSYAFAPFTEEEILLAYTQAFFLYGDMNDFIPWLIERSSNRAERRKRK